jgi:hypothetical protein
MDERAISLAGAIPNARAMQELIEALVKEGFERAQFGVLGSEEAYKGFLELAAKPENERTVERSIIGRLTDIGTVAGMGVAIVTILAGGGIGVALAGFAAAGGGGALAEVLAAAGFHHEHAHKISNELARHRLVAWIAPRGPSQADLAKTLLTRAGAPEIFECDGDQLTGAGSGDHPSLEADVP